MRKLLVISLCLLSIFVSAQDPHFSQYFNVPQLYNPARVGDFFGDVRASTHYRNQWKQAGAGYGTRAAELQAKLFHKKHPNFLALGAYIVTDQAGKAQIHTFQWTGAATYHMKLSSKNFVSTGLQVGRLKRQMDVAGLAWDSQYNGYEYDPSAATGENFGAMTDIGMDAALGAHYVRKERWYTFSGGYSFRHYGQNQTILAGSKDRLPIRQVMYGSAETNRGLIRYRWDLMIQRQRKAMEYNIGMRAEYRFGDDSRYTDVNKSSALLFGMYYRVGDAITPVLGAEWKRTASLFISYDFPLSRVTRTVTFLGGPELTLVYQGIFEKKRKLAD